MGMGFQGYGLSGAWVKRVLTVEGEVVAGLNSTLPEEGQISDQVVRRQRGGMNTKSGASSRN